MSYLQLSAQSAITAITTSDLPVATNTENNIKGAGYAFSNWTSVANFTINYSSDASADITQITSFNTASFSSIQVVAIPGAIAKVRRVANADITDTRDFITTWNRISSGPLAGAASGTFNCISPKVISMEAALLTNNINSGYDNAFENQLSQPHYNNIERIDYIIPSGIVPLLNLNEMGFPIFDRGIGDDFKIAAITGVDASNNPTSYGNLVSVTAANFSAAGLLASNFDYTIFVSDPLVASGEHRPSTRANQNIRGVFISLLNLGIAINQRIYGYSLFAQDVNPAMGHVLTNPATFPTNTNFAGVLDLVNVTGLFKTSSAVLPVKISSLTASLQSKGVVIKWETAMEQNIQNFSVEKSTNSTDWEQVQTVLPSNNPSGSVYQLTDNDIKKGGKYYYRIKTTDLDGSAEYSKVVMVEAEPDKSIAVRFFNSKIIVNSNSEIASVQLIDIPGRILNSFRPSGRVTSVEMPVNNLAPGVYLIKVLTKNGEKKVAKIVL
jgi:hypothetical protein